MLKKVMTVMFLMVSISAFANSMSQEPPKKGFELSTDIQGSRRDYQKQSRVSFSKTETIQVAEAEGTAKETTEPAAPKEPIIHNGAGTQRRSGGMRY